MTWKTKDQCIKDGLAYCPAMADRPQEEIEHWATAGMVHDTGRDLYQDWDAWDCERLMKLNQQQ